MEQNDIPQSDANSRENIHAVQVDDDEETPYPAGIRTSGGIEHQMPAPGPQTTEPLPSFSGPVAEANLVSSALNLLTTRHMDVVRAITNKNAETMSAVVSDAVLSPAVAKLAYLTVRNQSLLPQSFILMASPPIFSNVSLDSLVGFRYGVYQATRRVAGISGSYTFALPADRPLFWAGSLGELKSVVVVTGRARYMPNQNVKLFTSDYTQLATRETRNRRCIMTMPEGDEPRFKTEKEMGSWALKSRQNMEDGTIDIHVANTFDMSTSASERAFVGIGAPDPYDPWNVIPVCSWDAKPGALYIVKPRLSVWRLAQMKAEPGDVIDPALIPTAREVLFNINKPPSTIFYNEANLFAGSFGESGQPLEDVD